jgi:cellulose synthase/poly-beta-1,6-N-acetylglucosamine synthase-like glycosyltransferase
VLVNTEALAWAVMTLALCLNVFRLWTCCLPEPRVSACPQVDINAIEPAWTILVPLYQEAGSVGSLLNALDKLDWPKDKIDLVFACEADDSEILAALTLRRHSHHFRIIGIPIGRPRTKPKALQTALPFCRGRYLTVYDAEDLPASGQLREAWRAFRNGPATLAVVQAPLVICNERESWISRQFALDFAIWVLQRGRRIQGHIQTVSVHFRTRRRLPLQLSGFDLLAFLLGLTTGPLNEAILFVSVLLAIGQTIAGASDQVLLWVLSLALSQAIVGMLAVLRDGRNSFWIACFALPLYQVCQVLALFRAI